MEIPELMGVAADLGIKVSPKDELQDVIYAILDKAAENSAAGIPEQPKRKRTRISKKDTDRVYTVKGEEGENFDVKNGHKAAEDKPLPLFSDKVPAAEQVLQQKNRLQNLHPRSPHPKSADVSRRQRKKLRKLPSVLLKKQRLLPRQKQRLQQYPRLTLTPCQKRLLTHRC